PPKPVPGAFAVPPPGAYARPEQKEAVSFVACVDKNQLVPVLLIGQPLLVDKKPERELAFELGRKLCSLRPERLLRFVLPQPAQLQHIIEAAMTLGGGEEGPGELQ